MPDSPIQSSAGNAPLLEVRGVGKRFPGVRALHNIDMTLGHGEVLALIGENGAGKSTLMKILAGVQEPDDGQLLVDGRTVRVDSVRAASALGIALIHQELNLADNLDVGANIYLGREPHKAGFIDRKAIDRGATEALSKIGLNVSPHRLVRTMSIGHQQMIEIAKALSANARVLIMDEPTSSLSSGEVENLFRVIKDLRAKGTSIIYISHRLGEVKELADRVVAFRDGENAGELSRDQITHDAMVGLMVGRDLSQFYARDTHTPGEVALRVKGLITPQWPTHALNFEIRAGQIVGVAGLVGAGRTEMLQSLFGVNRPLAGTIEVDGHHLKSHAPIDAIRAGLALVPEDRKQQGLIVDMSVRDNVSLASLERHARHGFLNFAREAGDSTEAIAKLRIKTPHDRQIARFLSGGNQQKIVIGKWLAMAPKVLLLDEPTRGIDIGAKREIYTLMEELAAQGMAILFVSSEMEEILGMSDRTIVMHEGRITGTLDRSELSEEAIMRLATGRTHAA